jgi:hypothetical protein
MSFMDGVVDRAYNSGARGAKQKIIKMLEEDINIAKQFGKHNVWVLEKVLEQVKELEVERPPED